MRRLISTLALSGAVAFLVHSASAAVPLAPIEVRIARVTATELRDPRDGLVYRTVRIGKLDWFAENLRYASADSRCYRDDKARCTADGRLYRFRDAIAACPRGWRTPSDSDWFDLERAVGVRERDLPQQTARGDGPAKHLKVGGKTGFDARFAGWIGPRPAGVSTEVGASGAYWTSSTASRGEAWHRDISTDSDIIIRTSVREGYWLAVRCVRTPELNTQRRGNP